VRIAQVTTPAAVAGLAPPADRRLFAVPVTILARIRAEA
jgi:hypothetical protein